MIGSKHAIEIGEMPDSAAPAITMSASSSWIIWWPYPIASIPEVQPVETTTEGPCAPNFSATSLARLLGISPW